MATTSTTPTSVTSQTMMTSPSKTVNGTNGHHESKKCFLCLKSSPSPRVVTCGHTFCSACLNAKADQNNRFLCIVCQQPTKLGENDSVKKSTHHSISFSTLLTTGTKRTEPNSSVDMPNGVWNSTRIGTVGQGDNTKLSEDQKKLPDSKSAHHFMEIWSNPTSALIGGSDWPPPERRDIARPSSTNNINGGVSEWDSSVQMPTFGPLISWSSVVQSSSDQGLPPATQSSRLCSCEDVNNVVTSRCLDCAEDLCDFCVSAHLRVKLTRHHKVFKLEETVPTSDSLPPTAVKTPIKQPPFSEPMATPSAEVMKVYANVLEKAKADCDNLVTRVKLGIGEVDKATNRISSMKGRMEKRHKSAVTEIEAIVTSFVAAIQSRHRVLLERLEAIRLVKLSVLAEQEKTIDSMSARLNEVFNQLSAAIESGAEIDLINAYDSATDVVKEAEQIIGGQHQVFEDDTIVFEPRAQSILPFISCFGFVGGSCFAKNSYAEGDGIMTTAIGKDTKFFVYLYDQLNEPLTKGGDDVKIQIRDCDQLPVKHSTQDIQNGSYRVNWKPLKEGEHVISIKVKNMHIQDSPFRVRALQGRNYYTVREPRQIFGKEGAEGGELCRPWGICCARNGSILVANRSNCRIEVFAPKGEFLYHFGTQGQLPGQLDRPSGVCCDSNDRVIVADKDNHRIQIFSIRGTFVDVFGEKGNRTGQFNYPWDVACNSKDHILVSDTRNHRVQLFSPSGEFLLKYGLDCPMWKHFDSPRGVCFRSDGKAIITDFNNHRVLVVDLVTQTAQSLGQEGSADGMFMRPNGVAVDFEGNIFVADSRNDRIQIFTNSGVFINKIGSKGTGPGELDRPAGIAISPEGFIYIVDFGNSRVQVF